MRLWYLVLNSVTSQDLFFKLFFVFIRCGIKVNRIKVNLTGLDPPAGLTDNLVTLFLALVGQQGSPPEQQSKVTCK